MSNVHSKLHIKMCPKIVPPAWRSIIFFHKDRPKCPNAFLGIWDSASSVQGGSPDWPPASLPGQERTLEATGDVWGFRQSTASDTGEHLLPLKMGDNRGQHSGEEWVGGCGWSKESREGIMQTTTTARRASLEPEKWDRGRREKNRKLKRQELFQF